RLAQPAPAGRAGPGTVGGQVVTKLQSPNAKLQRNFKHQAPSAATRHGACLEFGAWRFSGIWRLGFGAFPTLRFKVQSSFFAICLFATAIHASSDALFMAGAQAYHSGDYSAAARAFRQSALQQPSSGALQNLGN